MPPAMTFTSEPCHSTKEVQPCPDRWNLLAADHLVAVVLGGQDAQTGLDDATTQTQHQMKGGLWNQ